MVGTGKKKATEERPCLRLIVVMCFSHDELLVGGIFHRSIHKSRRTGVSGSYLRGAQGQESRATKNMSAFGFDRTREAAAAG